MALVEFQNTLPGDNGRSDTATLQGAFPSSPALSGYNNVIVAQKMALLHDGIVSGNPDFPNQSLDWSDAPTGADPSKVGKPGGMPWTNYSPNVASPSAPGANPADIPAPPAGPRRPDIGTSLDSGAGSTRLPGDTSPQIASQSAGGGVTTNVNLDKGHSGATP